MERQRESVDQPEVAVDQAEVAGPIARGVAWALVRLRLVIVAGWILAAIGVVLYLPGPSESEGEQVSDLVPTDAPALEAEIASFRLFDFPLLTRLVMVQRDPDGLSPEAQARVYARALAITTGAEPSAVDIAGAFPVTNTLGLLPGSSEQSTTAVTYLFFRPDLTFREQTEAARRFAGAAVNEPGDAFIGVTGAIPARLQQTDVILRYLPVVEIATVLLISLIVGLYFGSLVAPLVALFTSGIAYVLSLRVVAWAGGQLGVTLPRDLEPVIVVLLLGIVTDYCIFFFSGLRLRLLSGEPRVTAAQRTTAEYIPIIFTAGLIVAAGTAALLVASLGFLRAFGPGLALTVLISLAVAVTLVPALLAILGKALFWPRISKLQREQEWERLHDGPGPEHERGPRPSFRSRVAHAMTARPVAAPVALLALGLLVLAGSGLLRMELGFTLINGLPAKSEEARASVAAMRGFADGVLSPTLVLLRGEGVADQTAELREVQETLGSEPGVAGIIGPGTPLASNLPPGITVSESGDAARLVVILDSDPLGGKAIENLRSLQRKMPETLSAHELSGVRASFAGDTALAAEAVTQTYKDLTRVGIAALVIDLLLLIVFLRALVAPLYLLAASVLALAASLGLTTYLFQLLLGRGELTYYVPFAAAVLLVSLGSDYNVFLVGRIWREARVRPLREAVATVAPQASRAIAVAGLTLALSFAVLAIVPLVQFREFAFAMLVGVLVDSFLVRSLLVPALVSVFGRSSWWPARAPGPAAPIDEEAVSVRAP
ncbi:MMPL family transporter [soil metagenome]